MARSSVRDAHSLGAIHAPSGPVGHCPSPNCLNDSLTVRASVAIPSSYRNSPNAGFATFHASRSSIAHPAGAAYSMRANVGSSSSWRPCRTWVGVQARHKAVEALRTHRSRQAQERLAIGPGYSTLDLVFAHADGRPLNPPTVSRTFDRLVEAAGVLKISLHGLRHTFATLALLDGIPSKVVAEVLGHSSTRVTEDLDQHVTPA